MSSMSAWLTDQANYLNGAVSAPPGWVIVPDYRTDNLLVHDGERGFAVVGPVLKEWTPEHIVAAVNTACADLVARGHTDICSSFTLAELLAQGDGPTTFD